MQIDFKDNRESGETLTRQCQLVMLRMLKYLDYYCRKYSVEYFLVGGSLLGAIRHNGFIPWDDDLDVGMTRDNYEKFLKNVVPHLPHDIFYQDPNTDPGYPEYDYVDCKLRDKYSHYTKGKYTYHDGLQLDIFVFDKVYYPNNKVIIFQNVLFKFFNIKKEKLSKWLKWKLPFEIVYSCNYLHKFGQFKLGKFYIKSSEIEELVNCRFEDIEVFVPKGWHECLSRQYGDYMKLPPEEKRVCHHDTLPDPFNPCDHKEILYWDRK